MDVNLGPRDALRSNLIPSQEGCFRGESTASREGRFRDEYTGLSRQYLLDQPIMPALDYSSIRVDLSAWSISASKEVGGKAERSACLLLQVR